MCEEGKDSALSTGQQSKKALDSALDRWDGRALEEVEARRMRRKRLRRQGCR